MSKHDDAYEISRRDFATRLGGVAAAAIVAGRDSGRRPARRYQAATPARVMGANDRVVLASIGVRGQGNALKRGFARLTERRDQDALRHRREPRATSASTTRSSPTSPTFKPATCRTCGASSTTRTSTASSSPRRTTGTRWPRSGRCRPASTSTSKSPPRTRSGKAGKMVEAATQVQQDRPGRHDEPQPPGGAQGHRVHPGRRHRQGLHGARPVLQARGPASASIPTARWRPASSTS